jgi:polyisoprenoid-binding protein YceI
MGRTFDGVILNQLGRMARSMRSSARFCLVAAALALQVERAEARIVDYSINQDTATIAFSTHVAQIASIDGAFKHFTGRVELDTDKPSAMRIDVVVDDSSIDVPFGGASTLRSAPYFDWARFPTIRFHSDSVQSASDDRFRIIGNLTIRDVSHPQTLTGVLTHGKLDGIPVLHVVVHTQLCRRDFGMVADRSLIADEVILTITTTLRAP